ncbi:hypothetical protein LUR56_31135 [Streptomyces sp. MT29]|nr:hypothetical protein [Streptomyces sp. MT29]
MTEPCWDDVFHVDGVGRRQPVGHWSELLWQEVWWQDPDGAVWRLDELDPGRCAAIHQAVTRGESEVGTRLAWESTLGMAPVGDVAVDVVTRGDMELLDLVGRRGWIQETDLVLALRRRMNGLPAAEGECFCGYPVAEGWEHSACRAGMEIA